MLLHLHYPYARMFQAIIHVRKQLKFIFNNEKLCSIETDLPAWIIYILFLRFHQIGPETPETVIAVGDKNVRFFLFRSPNEDEEKKNISIVASALQEKCVITQTAKRTCVLCFWSKLSLQIAPNARASIENDFFDSPFSQKHNKRNEKRKKHSKQKLQTC